MSTLAGQLDDYLRLRRGLGFQLGQHGSVLPGFVAYVAASGAGTVTVELAVTWARLPVGIKPITGGFRLSEVRGFARYLHAIDPAHEVHRPACWGSRPAPHALHLTPGQIAEILRATQRLQPPLRAATYRTLLGLLAATGMRLGEATALTRADVGLAEGMVTVRTRSSTGNALSPCTRRSPRPPCLRRHAGPACPTPRVDGSSCPSPGGPCGGERPPGLPGDHRADGSSHRHRPPAHSWPETQLCRAHPPRLAPPRRGHLGPAAVLSTYLGHVDPGNTYWYYSDSRVIPMPAALRG